MILPGHCLISATKSFGNASEENARTLMLKQMFCTYSMATGPNFPPRRGFLASASQPARVRDALYSGAAGEKFLGTFDRL